MDIYILAAESDGFRPQDFIFMFAVLAIVIITPIMIKRSRRRSGQNHGEDLDDIRERAANAGRIRSTADQALVDLLETSREISAQIDTKIRILNKLVRDADAKCKRLEKLLGMPEDSVSPPRVGTAAEEQPHEGARSRSGRLVTNMQSRIANLANEGRSLAEIAHITHLSPQEVKLALQLLGIESKGV